MTNIQKLENSISSTRSKLISHPVYNQLDSKQKLISFMEIHVFAVWDFMSLIKALQRNLTCVDVPWVPNSNNFSGNDFDSLFINIASLISRFYISKQTLLFDHILDLLRYLFFPL